MLNRVVMGDCEKVLSGMPSNSVDLIFTSPPYFNAREYTCVRNVRRVPENDEAHLRAMP
jgi:DNA modification methylase